MTVKESNELFFDIHRKRNALVDVNQKIKSLKCKIATLETISDVLQESICKNCTSKDASFVEKRCEYCRDCDQFKDKRKENKQ